MGNELDIEIYNKQKMPCNDRQKTLCKNYKCETCYNRSFASYKKSKYWSDTNEITPREAFKSSHKIYAFKCDDCDHVFESGLDHIVNGQWCPYCKGCKLCHDENCDFCYKKSFASHPKSKYWSQENIKTAREITKVSGQKFLFDCTCGHEFKIQIANIKNGQWCSYCSNPPQKLCDNDDCDSCFNNSFASHKKSKYFSDNDISPRNLFKSSSKKILLNCKCGHRFESTPSKIKKGSWCPFCSNPTKKLCGDDDCQTCMDKSFASHSKAKYWSDKNKKKPRDVALNSNNKYIFNCKKCKHEFNITLNNLNHRRGGCPFCSDPPKKLCDNTKCDTCYNKSFASHPKAKYWSDKNKEDPRNIFKSSNKKFYFTCKDCNHDFHTSPSHVNDNKWCPICINKTEKKLYKWLDGNYENVIHQPKYDWCKNIKYLPFDFVLEDYKIIIELDGPQHFVQISNWQDPKIVRKNDIYKMNQAIKQGYSIIRLLQEDVWKDKIAWKKKLQKHLHKQKNPHIIYICKNNEYNEYNIFVDEK